jgi:ribosomal protein S18 acetylase RimI-like enzyme
MIVRVLTETDAPVFRDMRLRALREEPAAFTSSIEEFSRHTLDKITARLRSDPAENFTLGAFDGEQLVGLVGFHRETASKLRHKGNLISLYVAPEAREQGIGLALLREVIRRAHTIVGLEQMLLGVMVTQTAARKLYEALGFVVFGREPRAVKVNDQFFDEEFMVLDLREDQQ